MSIKKYKIEDFDIGDVILFEYTNTDLYTAHNQIVKVLDKFTFKIAVEPLERPKRFPGHYMTEHVMNEFYNILVVDKENLSAEEIKLKYPEYFI